MATHNGNRVLGSFVAMLPFVPLFPEGCHGKKISFERAMARSLGELCQDSVSEATLRLVHEAKKLAGAKVTTIEGGN